jgi:hypothetical protein
MQRTFVALGLGLTLAMGSAFAQQQGSGPTMTDKAKEAAQAIGEKARDAMDKVKEAAQDAADKSKADDNEKAARSGQGDAPNSKIERMQKQADAELKAAKAKCDSIEPRVQKTVCEKQAAAVHANAELRIAKAHAAAQSGKTSTMGAGKAAR